MPFHSTLHCARSCRLLGARVGALSSRCDAAASGAQRAGLLRARRGYLVAWLVSASDSDWNQMELSKDMQIHYSGEQRSFRVRRCAITRSM